MKYLLKSALVVVVVCTMGHIACAESLRIGVKEDVPYFGYYNAKGERAGIDVDLGKAIANNLGRSATFVTVSSQERISVLKQNKVDLVIATFSITSDRLKHVQFSTPYYTDGQRIMVNSDSGIRTLADLSGKKVGVVKGATSGASLNKAVPESKLVYFNSYYEAYMGMLFDQVDAISSDGVVLRGLQAVGEGAVTELKQRKNKTPVFYLSLNDYKPGRRFRFLDNMLSKESYGIAVRKGADPKLISAINHFLNSHEGKSKLTRIIEMNMGGKQ